MPIEYSLMLKQPLTFEQNVRPVLVSHNIPINEIENLPRGIKIYTPNFTAAIIDCSKDPSVWEAELLPEEYNYSHWIYFTLNKNVDSIESASQVLSIVLSLIDTVSNALFLLIDNIVFHWDGSLLLINNDFGYWNVDNRIRKIQDKPYRHFG